MQRKGRPRADGGRRQGARRIQALHHDHATAGDECRWERERCASRPFLPRMGATNGCTFWPELRHDNSGICSPVPACSLRALCVGRSLCACRRRRRQCVVVTARQTPLSATTTMASTSPTYLPAHYVLSGHSELRIQFDTLHLWRSRLNVSSTRVETHDDRSIKVDP